MCYINVFWLSGIRSTVMYAEIICKTLTEHIVFV
jgi:hypothetical protein